VIRVKARLVRALPLRDAHSGKNIFIAN